MQYLSIRYFTAPGGSIFADGFTPNERRCSASLCNQRRKVALDTPAAAANSLFNITFIMPARRATKGLWYSMSIPSVSIAQRCRRACRIDFDWQSHAGVTRFYVLPAVYSYTLSRFLSSFWNIRFLLFRRYSLSPLVMSLVPSRILVNCWLLLTNKINIVFLVFLTSNNNDILDVRIYCG